jgi:hypothetical protein
MPNRGNPPAAATQSSVGGQPRLISLQRRAFSLGDRAGAGTWHRIFDRCYPAVAAGEGAGRSADIAVVPSTRLGLVVPLAATIVAVFATVPALISIAILIGSIPVPVVVAVRKCAIVRAVTVVIAAAVAAIFVGARC